MIGHRRVIPEVTYLITKKCFDERCLLKPTSKSLRALRYELARRAKQYGIRLHSFKFMLNHFHLVVTDSRATLPAFMRDFLTNTSKALQCALNVDSTIWEKKRYSAVRLLDLDAAMRKVAYTLLNPTRAELTLPEQWPGVTSARCRIGEPETVRRPDFYFSKRYCPETAVLEIEPVSPEFGLSSRREIAECEEAIADDVRQTARSITAEAKREGRQFAGVEKVKNTPLSKRGKRRIRERIPRFATLDRELMKQAIAEGKKFEWDHAVASYRFRQGERDVLFPHGTYGYRVLFGVAMKSA